MGEQEAISATERLIALLRDGERGFQLLSERVVHAECRAFLWEESRLRGSYADNLERSLGRAEGSVHREGTKLAALHRRWTEVKAKLGAGDCALLETTEICEWFAVRTYDEVLREGALPDRLRSQVAEQAGSVRRSQALVKGYREITHGQAERAG